MCVYVYGFNEKNEKERTICFVKFRKNWSQNCCFLSTSGVFSCKIPILLFCLLDYSANGGMIFVQIIEYWGALSETFLMFL